MKCPNCLNKMTVLFTSVVCDVCDPPGGPVKRDTSRKAYQGWIASTRNIHDVAKQQRGLFVFESPETIREWCKSQGVKAHYDFYQVTSSEPLKYTSIEPGDFDYVLVPSDFQGDHYGGRPVVRPV